MATEPSIDYSAVLADLKAKRDKLDAAIAGIETMLGVRDANASAQGSSTSNGADALGPGAFLGMSIPDAAAKFLRATRQNQKNEDIVNALKKGGIVFTGDNPLNVVNSVLARNWDKGGEIVRVS